MVRQSTITLNSYHAYKFIDVPADARDFTVDLELTRGLTRKGRVVDLDGKPVAGARCYGLVSTGSFIKTLPDATFEVHGLEPGYPRQVIFAHKGAGWSARSPSRTRTSRARPRWKCGSGRRAPSRGDWWTRTACRSRAPPSRSCRITGPATTTACLTGPGALWPDDETFTADSDGRFEVTGLKPGVRCFIGVHIKARPNTRIDTGQVFRNIVPERLGEVRDVGEVKVKVSGRVIGPGRRSRCGPILIRRSRATLGEICPRRRCAWDLRRVVHLHRRAGFAATWDEIQRNLKDGPEPSIDRLLEGKARARGVPDGFAAFADRLADLALPRPSPIASRAGGSTACSSARIR